MPAAGAYNANAPLRKGFEKIPGLEGRRFHSTQFSEEMQVACEITVPADMSPSLPLDRSNFKARPGLMGIPHIDRMGADIGDQAVYLNAEHNELFFVAKERIRQNGMEAIITNRAQGWTSFNGFPLDGIKTNDEMRSRVQCIGICINQVRYQMGNETEKQTAVRVAGAGSIKNSGNMPIEIGQGVTYQIHSIYPPEREREIASAPNLERPREKLCPVLVPQSEQDIWDFVNDSITDLLRRTRPEDFDFTILTENGRFGSMRYSEQHGLGYGALACMAAFAGIMAASGKGWVEPVVGGTPERLAARLGLTGELDAIDVDVVKKIIAVTYYSAITDKDVARRGRLDDLFGNNSPYVEDNGGSLDALMDEQKPVARLAQVQSVVGHKPQMGAIGAYQDQRRSTVMTALSNAGPREDMQYVLTLNC